VKVALVHEFLNQLGGGERVLMALSEIFPQADIYALLSNQETASRVINKNKLHFSFLQKLPDFLKKRHKILLPLYPFAVEQFDLSSYDLIISDSSSFAKGVITRPDSVHICYCHTPTGYLWHYTHQYVAEQGLSNLSKLFVYKMLNSLRVWDQQAAQKVDYFIANSKNVQQRIKKYYHRDSLVIYPPLMLKGWNLKPNSSCRTLGEKNYFLIVSRLSPYKKIDLAIKVFNLLPEEKLIIVGKGKDYLRLKKISRSNIKFAGFVPDELLKDYYQNCLALIFPSEEDFGLVPVEAMSFGKPVIAYQKGGVLETVTEGETGVFFKEPNVSSLLRAIKRFKSYKRKGKLKPETIKRATQKFSQEVFSKKIIAFVDLVCKKFFISKYGQ